MASGKNTIHFILDMQTAYSVACSYFCEVCPENWVSGQPNFSLLFYIGMSGWSVKNAVSYHRIWSLLSPNMMLFYRNQFLILTFTAKYIQTTSPLESWLYQFNLDLPPSLTLTTKVMLQGV